MEFKGEDWVADVALGVKLVSVLQLGQLEGDLLKCHGTHTELM